ncbi:MAG: hypothetical protein ACP5I7_05430 [Sulfolobales archaeon]
MSEEKILEEEVLPEVVIRGESKLVAPGFIDVFSIPYLSVIKDLAGLKIADLEELDKKIISKLSETELYYLSILGIASRIINGFTTVVAKLPRVEIGVKLVDTLNIRLIVALDLDMMDHERILDYFIRAKKWHNYKDGLLKITVFTRRREILEKILPHTMSEMPVFAGGDLCREELSPEIIRRIIFIDPPRELCDSRSSFEPRVVYTNSFEGIKEGVFYGTGTNKPQDLLRLLTEHNNDYYNIFSKLSREAALLLNIPIGSLERGYLSDLVIYDLSEAPVLGIFMNEEIVSRHIMDRELRIETMIVDGEFIIDAGETLYMGKDLFRKARSVLKEALREFL